MSIISISFYYLFTNLFKFSSHDDPNSPPSWGQNSRGLEIFYIFYANDCLLVARAFLRDVIFLVAILNAYITYSDQSINNTNSYIMFSSGTNRAI